METNKEVLNANKTPEEYLKKVKDAKGKFIQAVFKNDSL